MELGDDNLASAIDRLNSMGYGHRRGRHASGTFVNPVIRKEIWRQMVTIVKTLTENNIVHMDLKPDNLIVFGRTLKIADLGISKKPEMLG
jgi:serine/threonine protein kinase